MTLDEVIDRLRRAVEAAGSQQAWAKANGVTLAYVNDVLQGRRKPGLGILRGLSIEKVVDYREVRPRTEERGADE